MDGILASQALRDLVADGAITAAAPLGPAQIQPSSLDLRLGRRIWRLQCSFLPGRHGVQTRIGQFAVESATLGEEPVVLHHRGVYLAEVEEGLALPPDVHGRANPKSSTGRLDVFVRVLTEEGHAFDVVPAGYRGRLYLEITPQSFDIGVRRGDCLSQLRLGRGRARLGPDELEAVQASGEPAVYWSNGHAAPVEHGDNPGVQMSVDLHDGDDGIVGYIARRFRPPVDLARRDLDRDGWWTPISVAQARDGFVLEPEAFYIFATRERLCIPPNLCAELVPFDATKGELRTHYAGFIDSGFGREQTGLWDRMRGARLVLEIRTHDVPFLLEHGQPLFRIELLRNAGVPDVLYGTGSNYQMQGLKLAKQFR
jgi:dCTP deaminase